MIEWFTSLLPANWWHALIGLIVLFVVVWLYTRAVDR